MRSEQSERNSPIFPLGALPGLGDRVDLGRWHHLDKALDPEKWGLVCEIVAQLRSEGFGCARSRFDCADLSLIWCLLTYSYANGQIGTANIVAWANLLPEVQQRLKGDHLTAEDLRRFRRNNRKQLALALEDYFRREPSPVICRTREAYGLTPCELANQCLIEAVRADVAESDE